MLGLQAKILARESMLARPLTSQNVERHLGDVGLEAEYATHFRIGALSDGQKVKVVLGAAMWDQPHILILDEPTNYLDRESLGAYGNFVMILEPLLAGFSSPPHAPLTNPIVCPIHACRLAEAITVYEGGIIMITHNDDFCSQLCPERWVLEAGRLNTEGDVEWMARLEDEAVAFTELTEMIDGSGNKVTAGLKMNVSAKEKKKIIREIKAKIAAQEDLDSDDEAYCIEWNIA